MASGIGQGDDSEVIEASLLLSETIVMTYVAGFERSMDTATYYHGFQTMRSIRDDHNLL